MVVFLSLSEVLQIHRDQIARYGGTAGIRDLDLLKSAVGVPMTNFGGIFLHTSLHEMAAAYLYHLVQNHPFLDGNKRVGTVSALVFLLLNGQELRAPEEELADVVLSVARGEIDKAEVALFMRKWSVPITEGG